MFLHTPLFLCALQQTFFQKIDRNNISIHRCGRDHRGIKTYSAAADSVRTE